MQEISQINPDNLEILNSTFDNTIWEQFILHTENIHELTDTITEYINFNIDMILPKKKVKQYPNSKPWITSKLRKKIIDKHSAFKRNDPN